MQSSATVAVAAPDGRITSYNADARLLGFNMHQTYILRISWALLLVLLLLLAFSGWFDRLFGTWAYASESAKIQAHREELAQLGDISRGFRSVAAVAKPGVVHIRVPSEVLDSPELSGPMMERLRDILPNVPDGQLQDFLEPDNSGSGVIFNESGYILTNNHVVGSRETVMVRLADDRTFLGRVVGTDPQTDLAVVKIDAPNLHALPFGDSDALEVGDWVLAVGAPFGLAYTVTHGIVSALDRRDIGGVDIAYQDFIQTDASINPGNSGGPLMNMRGEVVGINTAIATRGTGVNAGVAFTIPSNQAQRIADQLVRSGRVVRGWLGISMDELVAGDAEVFGLDRERGILVNQVLGDTPAERAGVRVEDIIVAVDGRSVGSIPEMRQRIADLPPGHDLTLDVIRYGERLTLALTLGEQPDQMRRLPVAERTHEIDELGVSVRSLRSVAAETLGHGANTRGVVVFGVLDEDRDVPLNANDVIIRANDREVRNVADLEEALRRTGRRDRVELTLLDERGSRRTVYVTPQR